MCIFDTVEFLLEVVLRSLPLIQEVLFAPSRQILLHFFEVRFLTDDFRVDVDSAANLKFYIEHIALRGEGPYSQEAGLKCWLNLDYVPGGVQYGIVHVADEVAQCM